MNSSLGDQPKPRIDVCRISSSSLKQEVDRIEPPPNIKPTGFLSKSITSVREAAQKVKSLGGPPTLKKGVVGSYKDLMSVKTFSTNKPEDPYRARIVNQAEPPLLNRRSLAFNTPTGIQYQKLHQDSLRSPMVSQDRRKQLITEDEAPNSLQVRRVSVGSASSSFLRRRSKRNSIAQDDDVKSFKSAVFSEHLSAAPVFDDARGDFVNQHDFEQSSSQSVSFTEEEEKLGLGDEDKEVKPEKTKWDKLREKVAIPSTSLAYQIWKVIIMICSFLSSFDYAIGAALLNRMPENEVRSFRQRDWAYFSLFCVDLAVSLLLAEHLTPKHFTWEHYFRSLFSFQFLVDIIATIPFPAIIGVWLHGRPKQLCYLVHSLRLIKGFKLLEYKSFTRQLKALQNQRVQQMMLKRELAESQDQDTAQLKLLGWISQLLKTLQLIVIIMCLSVFTGLLWLISSDLFSLIPGEEEGFFHRFSLGDKSASENTILATYYAFTTLSTVGLGDFHPTTNNERMMCSMLLLFGVMITSVIMENFSEMIKVLRNFDKDFNQSSELDTFFSSIQRFNHGRAWSEAKIESYKEYFGYRWKSDKNLAVSTLEDEQLLEQLPRRVIIAIYFNFLFRDFIDTYKPWFEPRKVLLIRRQLLQRKNAEHLMITDPESIVFNDLQVDMILCLLQGLEPISFKDGTILQKAEEETSEIYFILKGEIEVGYNHKLYRVRHSIDMISSQSPERVKSPQLGEPSAQPLSTQPGLKDDLKEIIAEYLADKANSPTLGKNKLHFPLKLSAGQPACFYEVLFDQDTQFLYRASVGGTSLERAEMFFIRRSRVKKMLLKFADLMATQVFEDFKNSVIRNYIDKIYLPMIDYQKEQIQKDKEEDGGPDPSIEVKKNLTKLLFGGAFKAKTSSKKVFHPPEDKALLSRNWSRPKLIKMIRTKELKKEDNAARKLDLIRFYNIIEKEEDVELASLQQALNSTISLLEGRLLPNNEETSSCSDDLSSSSDLLQKSIELIEAEEKVRTCCSALEIERNKYETKINELEQLVESQAAQLAIASQELSQKAAVIKALEDKLAGQTPSFVKSQRYPSSQILPNGSGHLSIESEERKEEVKSSLSRQISQSKGPSSDDDNDYNVLAIRHETPILSRLDLPAGALLSPSSGVLPQKNLKKEPLIAVHSNPGRSCSDTKLPPISQMRPLEGIISLKGMQAEIGTESGAFEIMSEEIDAIQSTESRGHSPPRNASLHSPQLAVPLDIPNNDEGPPGQFQQTSREMQGEGPIEEVPPHLSSHLSLSEQRKTPMKMEEEQTLHPRQISSQSRAESRPVCDIANPIFYQRVDSDEEFQIQDNDFVMKMNSSHIVLVDDRLSMMEETVQVKNHEFCEKAPCEESARASTFKYD